jgi:TRAP-type C4-dicarboxylate transport system permease large subunit/TRAP-type C4-dicarboxylate transport system permease small subunit
MTSTELSAAPAAAWGTGRALQWPVAILVVAQALVVGLQVIARHVMRQPIPWTEEIARLLLVWLMCVGGVAALARSQHPRVTVLVRLLSESRRSAVDRGLRLVRLAFFLCLVVPSWRLTAASAGEQLPASGLSGAAISGVLPVALLLMSAVLVQQLRREGIGVWRDRGSLAWSLGTAGLAIASVLVPLLAGIAPLAVLVVGFLVTAGLGMPLAFTLALTSLTYLLGIGGVSLIILPIKILGGVDSFVLLAIPLFILGGALMESGGISERIVNLAMAIVGRVRGGLAMVAVVAEVLFSGISGSTAADVSAISSLLVPSMRRAGYSGPESVSIVAAASAMGILVPPCLTMVVLGSLVNLSIVTLFLAGFIPAFILASVLLVLIALRARRQDWPVSGRVSKGELARAARRAAVPLGLPVLLFGGIFSGATTVTEAALLAVVYALVAGALMNKTGVASAFVASAFVASAFVASAFRRKISGGVGLPPEGGSHKSGMDVHKSGMDVHKSGMEGYESGMDGFHASDHTLVGQLAQSGIVTATTLWVLAAASAFAWILVREWVPQTLGEWIASVGLGRVGFLTLTVVLFVIIGALLEGLPALLIFGPILFPIGRAIGVDPVHYGIVIIAAMGIAFFLPPVGVGLSIAAGIARVDIDDVSRTYVPYLIALLVGLALIGAFPDLTLVLPRLLLSYGP